MLSFMVYVVLVTLLLTLAAVAAEQAMRLRRQATRWVWLGTLLASLLVPATIASVSIQVPDIGGSAPGPVIALRSLTSLPLPRLPLAAAHPPSVALGAGHAVSLDTTLKCGWLLASVSLACLLFVSGLRLGQRSRGWRQSQIGGMSVYIGDSVGPAVVGLLRPRIVLPPWVLKADAERQALVLAHERSHLTAGDPLLLTIAVGLLVFMPWNLPLWWQLRRLRCAIEVDCDARVLSAGHDVQRYGETLIEVGERQSGILGTVAAMAEYKSFLEQRISIMSSIPGRWYKLSATLLVVASLCLAGAAAQVTPPTPAPATAEPVVASVDPAVYDGYVGSYKLADSLVAHVTRDGAHLFLRLTAQGPLEFFPSSQTEFFAKAVNAQISFTTDSQGHATAFTLHQNGRNMPAPRMDEAAAQVIESALQAKVQSQSPTPGTEAAVRKHLAALLAGTPNFEDLSPEMVTAAHQQQAALVALARRVGPIQSMQFMGVQPNGWDVYLVTP